jgi:phage host-nuclease inhibitor protein Gam
MNQVLADNRKLKMMTAEAADALFAEIATIELEAATIGADGDAQIQKIKECYEGLLQNAKLDLPEKVEFLTAYILANSERFQKPRARKTPEGQYGLRSVSNLEINDDQEVINYAKGAGMPELLDITIKINKPALLKAINEGHIIKGVSVASGEREFYKVAQELLARAKGK